MHKSILYTADTDSALFAVVTMLHHFFGKWHGILCCQWFCTRHVCWRIMLWFCACGRLIVCSVLVGHQETFCLQI